MVKVRDDHPLTTDGQVDLESWLQKRHSQLDELDVAVLRRACEVSQQAEARAIAAENIWSPYSSSFQTGLDMAVILADLKLDQDSLVAAVLYRAVREGKLALEAVQAQFGAAPAKLIDGVLKMAAIGAMLKPNPTAALGQQASEQLDSVRKMLMALVDDVRVALIKLAERTCAIRAVKNADEQKRYKVAREVFDIYAPLAHRLGIGHLKWELEDLSFRYIEPDTYKRVAKMLDEKRVDREQYMERAIAAIKGALHEQGIDAKIDGRVKHIYSIWRKMQRKAIDFSQIYDIRAVRVMVAEVKDCYAALGVVHTLWKHIPKEFDDYIAMPKPNGYRSLHTAVVGPEGKVLEVQIRTQDMHEEAELGVCAHWHYKQGGKLSQETGYEQKIAWLRQVLDWHEELGDLSALADQLNREIHQERIYVFTPEGHVVDLQSGATPLDFAYGVHTQIGHRCRGAKVNGRIVPLTYQLKTGEQVEVLTVSSGTPSRDWLVPSLGYLKTSKARAKVQHWFKQQAKEENISVGRTLFEKEFHRVAVKIDDLDKLAQQVNLKNEEDLYAAIGAGDVRIAHVLTAAQKMLGHPNEAQPQLNLALNRHPHESAPLKSDVVIRGVGNLLTHMAGCCQPVPGDEIIGYITVGRGVTIHRRDCNNVAHMQETATQRLIEVSWGAVSDQHYPVDVILDAYDRPGLLKDITMIVANEKVEVTRVNMTSNKGEGTIQMHLTIEVNGLETLGRVLGKLNQLPNVIEVSRQQDA